jgi:paired amphipathic helix protein Sin3a
MPDRSQQLMKDAPTSSRFKERVRRKLDSLAHSSSSLPQKRKRKATEKEKEREREQALTKNLPPVKANRFSLLYLPPSLTS